MWTPAAGLRSRCLSAFGLWLPVTRCLASSSKSSPAAAASISSNSSRSRPLSGPVSLNFAHLFAGEGLSPASRLADSLDPMMTALTDPVLGLEVPDQVTYFKEMLRVNVTTGKMLRGNAVLQSLLCIRREPEAQLLLTAHAVGWAFEVMQAAFLIADDIMDGSVTRRGKPCWYKMPEIGMMAVNDVISLQTAVYELLTRFAKWHPEYQTLVDLLTACFRLTVMGQSLDAMTSPREGRRPDLALMTEARYATIAKYKTSYYTFSHPQVSTWRV